MKISDNVIVGVQYLKLCEFYNDLRTYTTELNNNYEHSKDDELIGLIVFTYTENKKEYLKQIYYTTDKLGLKKYTYTTDKEGLDKNWFYQISNSTLEDIKNEVLSQNYIIDLNYFYKNM